MAFSEKLNFMMLVDKLSKRQIKWVITPNFVAFSEKLNFNNVQCISPLQWNKIFPEGGAFLYILINEPSFSQNIHDFFREVHPPTYIIFNVIRK